MANFKLVNGDQLDADLKKVADSIREKGETNNSLTFPDGFVSAVKAIETGSKTTVKKASGSVTISNGSATVNCGFQPDVVVLDNTFCFYLENGSFNGSFANESYGGLVYITVSATGNGFAISDARSYQSSAPTYINKTSNYVAVKYTE